MQRSLLVALLASRVGGLPIAAPAAPGGALEPLHLPGYGDAIQDAEKYMGGGGLGADGAERYAEPTGQNGPERYAGRYAEQMGQNGERYAEDMGHNSDNSGGHQDSGYHDGGYHHGGADRAGAETGAETGAGKTIVEDTARAVSQARTSISTIPRRPSRAPAPRSRAPTPARARSSRARGTWT